MLEIFLNICKDFLPSSVASSSTDWNK